MTGAIAVKQSTPHIPNKQRPPLDITGVTVRK
jgi:hypothetical protein